MSETVSESSSRVDDKNKAHYEAYAANLVFNEASAHNEALANVQASIEQGRDPLTASIERGETAKRRIAETALQTGDFRYIDEGFREPRQPHHDRKSDLHSFEEVDRELVVNGKETEIIRSAGISGDHGFFKGFDTDKLKALKPISEEERSEKMTRTADAAGKDHDAMRRDIESFLGPEDPYE